VPKSTVFDEPTSARHPERMGELDVTRHLAEDGMTKIGGISRSVSPREVVDRLFPSVRGVVVGQRAANVPGNAQKAFSASTA
jgi:ABC-type histidine transport system ATPase subunit